MAAKQLDVVDALIEEIASAAVVVDRGGRVLHANRRGRALVAQRDAHDELLASIRSGQGRFLVSRVRARSRSTAFLAVDRSGPVTTPERLAAAATRWKLTRRQTQVLGELVQGRSNRAIGAALGIAAATVEIHVGAIATKAHADSRAELIAWFWSEI